MRAPALGAPPLLPALPQPAPQLRCAAACKAHSRPSAANYLEIADIDTVNTAVNVSTADSFTDGLTLADGTMVPLNQVRLQTA